MPEQCGDGFGCGRADLADGTGGTPSNEWAAIFEEQDQVVERGEGSRAEERKRFCGSPAKLCKGVLEGAAKARQQRQKSSWLGVEDIEDAHADD